MSDELRAAAERLRRLWANETYESVYEVEPTSHGLKDRDIDKVVAAYLAETDPSPLTVDSVTALLGPPVGGNEWRFGDGGYLFLSDGQARVTWDGVLLIVDTLGGLRTAMRHAGLPLPTPGEGR
jgi:hypothetical protein